MSDTVIEVENLSKKYIIGHQKQERYTALRDVIADGAKAFWRSLSGGGSGIPENKEEFWALKDVSFEVKQGECIGVIGIIGRNGAGKSTLLKILSRITEPTTGRIKIKGRVASLLEVGTGFHPELTGRENIFLNGSILGMSRTEIKAKFDEIVDFAEVEKFLDTPVKFYSSGMYMRLAFAVAAHLESEILIVDEVLAVGDSAFQKKCLGKMAEVTTKEGKTVLFVSHNIGTIAKLCSYGILLQKGEILFQGKCNECIQKYLSISGESDYESSQTSLNYRNRRIDPQDVQIINAWFQVDQYKSNTFLFNENNATLVILIEASKKVIFSIEIVLRNEQGIAIAFSPGGLGKNIEFECSQNTNETLYCELPPLQLAQGTYYIDLMLADPGVKFFDYIESALSFVIEQSSIGTRNWSFTQNTDQGCFLWDINYKMVN